MLKINFKKKKPSRNTTYLIVISLLLFQFYFFISIGVVADPVRTDISVHVANDMINNNTGYPDLLVLDVRSQVEYDTDHLFDAILIPDNEIAGRLDELALFNETEIIVYCRTGGRSLAASNILVSNNFSKIFNMLGGINAWIAEGYDYWQNEAATSIDFALPTFLISVLGITIILLLSFKHRWKRVKES